MQESKPNVEIIAQATKDIHDIVSSFSRAKGLVVAAQLNISNHIPLGEYKSVFEVAKEINVNSGCLYRLMRALSNINIFRELERSEYVDYCKGNENAAPFQHGLFTHTPITLALREEGIRMIAMMAGGHPQVMAYEGLLDTVKTGKTDLTPMLGVPTFWDYLRMDKEYDITFSKSMSGYCKSMLPALLQLSDFSSFKSVCDCGGSEGFLTDAILKNYNNVEKGINFDVAAVITNNKKNDALQKGHDPLRYQEIIGDFFVSVPEAECYTFKNVLHNWDDDSVKKILNNVYKSMVKGGKIYVYDFMDDAEVKNQKNVVPWHDVLMMVACNGKERTVQDWGVLIEDTKFKIDKIVRGPMTFGFPLDCVILAQK